MGSEDISGADAARYAESSGLILGAICLIAIHFQISARINSNPWLYAFISFPGVLLHEMLHLIVGLIMNAKPVGFSVWPKRIDEGGFRLGAVKFRNLSAWNAPIVALAPILGFGIAYLVSETFFRAFDETLINWAGYVILLFILVRHSLPSDSDWDLALESPRYLVAWLGLGITLFLGALFVTSHPLFEGPDWVSGLSGAVSVASQHIAHEV